MEQLAKPLPAAVVERIAGRLGTRRLLAQAGEPLGAEGAEGVADRLDAAADNGGDRLGAEAVGALQEDLASSEGKGIG